MDPEEFEAVVRRVVREELHRYYATGGRPHRSVVETPRRGVIASDDEGVRNVRQVLEYTKQTDPHGTMPKEELKLLVRMRFPEYGV